MLFRRHVRTLLMLSLCSGLLNLQESPSTNTATYAAPPKATVKKQPPGKPASEKAPVRSEEKASKPKSDGSDRFFADPQVVRLKIEIAPAELQKLKENNRSYVRCNVIENEKQTYSSVGLKLKGAAGSFREFDDRPALTLNMDRFNKEQSFHDLDKFHLNNSVQDESYLNELLCSELCRQMKIPATRVTHARVWLNGRDVGLYVLKEGFDQKFLKRHFGNASGNLYDGGFLQDVDVDLEKDSGTGVDDRSDLHALRDACQEPDPAIRTQRVARLLDVDRFINFMAFELMTCHWDGYTVNKNNYRIYFDTVSQKAHFLPHGMDQMFGDTGFSILDYPSLIVSSAVMRTPDWRKRYRARLKEFLPLFSPATKLIALVDTQHKRLLPVLREMGDDRVTAFEDQIRELKERLIARAENLVEQVASPEPAPLEFEADGFAQLGDWYGASESDDAIHEEPELGTPPKPSYSIKAGASGNCVASWRRTVLLTKGKYQFQAMSKTENLVAMEDDKGGGVGLRISGEARKQQLSGTHDWSPLTFDFEVLDEQRNVELVAETRSTAGQVWFDKSSLRLKRLP